MLLHDLAVGNWLRLVHRVSTECSPSAVKGEKIVPYIHAGSKLGVLVSLTGTDGVDYQSAGKDIGMQIAAMNPISLNSDGVDKSIVDKEIAFSIGLFLNASSAAVNAILVAAFSVPWML